MVNLRPVWFLLAGPILTFALFGLLARSDAIRRKVVIVCVVCIGIELATTLTSWSFSAFWVQEADLLLAYTSVCALVFLGYRFGQKVASAKLEYISLCLLAIVFYSFLVDYWRSDPVDSATQVAPHVLVLRRSGGWFAQNWEGVKVIYHPAYFPFLEKTLYAIRIGETDECNEATVHARFDPRDRTVAVVCDGPKPYLLERVKLP
jgi:hypothetical protein